MTSDQIRTTFFTVVTRDYESFRAAVRRKRTFLERGCARRGRLERYGALPDGKMNVRSGSDLREEERKETRPVAGPHR